jgi:3-oxoadipate enol-lactonase
MPTARLEDIDIYFERSGSGPRLLFINGSGSTLANMAPLIGVLTGTFNVLCYDQRGLGRSELPQSSYTMADLAHEALQLADHVGWDTFMVLGVSFGGMVAQELAVTSPERVRRLALVCTSAGGPGGSSYPLSTLADLHPDEAMRIRTSIIDTRFDPKWLEEHPLDRTIVTNIEQRAQVEAPEAVLKGEFLQLEARSAHDTFDRLPSISCPTFVASGRFDGIAPPANGAALAAQIPHAELHLYQGGHLFFIQDPTAFPEISAFLRADGSE